jgi:hypothetical protein
MDATELLDRGQGRGHQFIIARGIQRLTQQLIFAHGELVACGQLESMLVAIEEPWLHVPAV